MKERMTLYVDANVVKSARQRQLNEHGKINLSFAVETFLKDYAEHRVSLIKS